MASNYDDLWDREIHTCSNLQKSLRWYKDIVKPSFGETILEVGTGEGRVARSFLQYGIHYIGIDISKKILTKAKDRLMYGKELNYSLVLADAEFLPFRENVFDKSICFETAFFIPRQDKLIIELGRTIKKNGKIFCSFLNSSNSYILITEKVIRKLLSFLIIILASVKSRFLIRFTSQLFSTITSRGYGFSENWFKSYIKFGFPSHYPVQYERLLNFFIKTRLSVIQIIGFLPPWPWKKTKFEIEKRINCDLSRFAKLVIIAAK